MRGRTLRWLLGKIDQRRTYFLNGEVQTGEVDPVANLDLYQPVTYSGQTTPALRNWGRGWTWWPSGARWWCSSGSSRARQR